MSFGMDRQKAFDLIGGKEIVHQVALNCYGRRIVTASSDMSVGVWDRNETGQWTRTATWKVHPGPVVKTVWAHAQYGQVVATCSSDRSVFIWEETQEGGRSQWSKRAYITGSRNTVSDIRFAPHQLGLQLGTCSTEGIIRVYEAPDVTNLTQWALLHETQVFPTRCSSLSWSTNQALRPLLITGSDDEKSKPNGRLAVYELNDNLRKWQSLPSVCLSSDAPVSDVQFSPSNHSLRHQLAVAALDITVYNIVVKKKYQLVRESAEPTEYTVQKIAMLVDLKKAWKLSWNVSGSAFTACSPDGSIRVWKYVYYEEWYLVSSTDYDGKAKKSIPSVEYGNSVCLPGNSPSKRVIGGTFR